MRFLGFVAVTALLSQSALASQTITYALPSGARTVIERQALGLDPQSKTCVTLTAWMSFDGPSSSAHAVADEAFEYIWGPKASQKGCGSASIYVKTGNTNGDGSLYEYFATSAGNYRSQGYSTPRQPAVNRTGPIKVANGAREVYLDRIFDGVADTSAGVKPAVFAEYDTNGAQLSAQETSSALKELWLTQIKEHADQINAGSYRISLANHVPARFDFSGRTIVIGSRNPDGSWPELPVPAASAELDIPGGTPALGSDPH